MQLEQLVTTYGYPAILIGTFFEGETILIPGRFLVLNGMGAAIWSILVGFLGYSVGLTIELFLTEAKHYVMLILGAIAAIGSVIWFVHFLYERTQR